MYNIFGTSRDAGSPFESLLGSSPEPTPSASTESSTQSQSMPTGFRRWPKREKESTPKPLTFGIEFEFNLAFHQYTSDSEPHDPRVIHWPVSEDDDESEAAHHHVTNTLRKAGVAAHTFWNLEAEPKVQDWVVTDDTSVDAWDKHYEFLPLEVNTPPFYYCKDSRLNVSGVLALLTGTYRLHCNNSCGLHVHVGNAKKGFHPAVLCNLFAVLWAFEEPLTMLHSESRRTGKGRDYSRSLRDFSRLGQSLSATPEGTRMGLEKILELRNQDTIEKIVNLMGNYDRRLAYNVTN